MSTQHSHQDCPNGLTTPHKTRTPTKRALTKAQLIERLNQSEHNERIERDAKNKAYAYILFEGKYYGFADFCREFPEADWHAACLTGLIVELLDINPNKDT